MIWLALIGIIEAVVYQARYRSAVVGGPFTAAWWTFCTQATRVVWMLLGVKQWMAGADPVLIVACYGLPSALAVGVVRAIERRKVQSKPSLNEFISSQERADAEKHQR